MDKLIIGCGYLGRRVAKAWLRAGHRVSALTRSEAHAEEMTQAGLRPVIGDVCDAASLSGLPAADAVLYCVGYDRSSGRSQHEVSVDGLQNVLNQIRSTAHRLIYISSSSVYGQSAGEWVDEDSECHPVQEGGKSSLAAEALIRSYYPMNGIDGPASSANIIRLTGIYGPGRLLSRVDSLKTGAVFAGSGEAWLNLIHVDDAVNVVLACEEKGIPGATYLASDDQPVRRSEYFGLLAKLCGAPAPRFDPGQTPARGSGGINKRCSNRRMREELGVTLTYAAITSGLPHALQTTNEPSDQRAANSGG